MNCGSTGKREGFAHAEKNYSELDSITSYELEAKESRAKVPHWSRAIMYSMWNQGDVPRANFSTYVPSGVKPNPNQDS